MGYREIERSQANDGQGDDARTWSGKTNENMKELFSRGFMLNGVRVTRESYDPNDLKFDQFLQYDELTGWEDPVTRTRRVSGIIMSLPFTWPDDIDTEAKFFITGDRNR